MFWSALASFVVHVALLVTAYKHGQVGRTTPQEQPKPPVAEQEAAESTEQSGLQADEKDDSESAADEILQQAGKVDGIPNSDQVDERKSDKLLDELRAEIAQSFNLGTANSGLDDKRVFTNLSDEAIARLRGQPGTITLGEFLIRTEAEVYGFEEWMIRLATKVYLKDLETFKLQLAKFPDEQKLQMASDAILDSIASDWCLRQDKPMLAQLLIEKCANENTHRIRATALFADLNLPKVDGEIGVQVFKDLLTPVLFTKYLTVNDLLEKRVGRDAGGREMLRTHIPSPVFKPEIFYLWYLKRKGRVVPPLPLNHLLLIDGEKGVSRKPTAMRWTDGLLELGDTPYPLPPIPRKPRIYKGPLDQDNEQEEGAQQSSKAQEDSNYDPNATVLVIKRDRAPEYFNEDELKKIDNESAWNSAKHFGFVVKEKREKLYLIAINAETISITEERRLRIFRLRLQDYLVNKFTEEAKAKRHQLLISFLADPVRVAAIAQKKDFEQMAEALDTYIYFVVVGSSIVKKWSFVNDFSKLPYVFSFPKAYYQFYRTIWSMSASDHSHAENLLIWLNRQPAFAKKFIFLLSYIVSSYSSELMIWHEDIGWWHMLPNLFGPELREWVTLPSQPFGKLLELILDPTKVAIQRDMIPPYINDVHDQPVVDKKLILIKTSTFYGLLASNNYWVHLPKNNILARVKFSELNFAREYYANTPLRNRIQELHKLPVLLDPANDWLTAARSIMDRVVAPEKSMPIIWHDEAYAIAPSDYENSTPEVKAEIKIESWDNIKPSYKTVALPKEGPYPGMSWAEDHEYIYFKTFDDNQGVQSKRTGERWEIVPIQEPPPIHHEMGNIRN